MLKTDFNQPKGSTIGVLRDGRTIQQAFDKMRYADTLQELRTMEPVGPRDVATVRRATEDSVLVNAPVYYDKNDTTSPDDGISVFVTAGGARWKFNTFKGYCAGLAGLKEDGSNVTTVVNGIVNRIVAKMVAAGRVNNQQRTVNIPVTGDAPEWKLTGPLVWPTVISLVFHGSVLLDGTSLTAGKILNCNNVPFMDRLTVAIMAAGTNPTDRPGRVNQAVGRAALTCIGGEVTVRLPGTQMDGSNNPTIHTVGAMIGNDAACLLDARDIYFEKFNIIGAKTGIEFGCYNTFMCGVEHFNVSRCYDGFSSPTLGSNYGERMYLRNGTIGNMDRHGAYLVGGGDFTLENVSVDFLGGDLAHFGPLSPAEYKHLSGHIEGVKGSLAAKEMPASYSKALVILGKAVRRDDRVVDQNDYRGVRQLFACPQNPYGRMLKVINESYAPGREGQVPNNPYPCETGWPGNSGVELILPKDTFVDTPYVNSYSPAVRNSVNQTISFTTASTGPLGSNVLSTDYAFAAEIIGGATCSYGTSAEATSDGYMPFIITLSDPSDVVYLFCTNRFRPGSGQSVLWGNCSVTLVGTTGSIILAPVIASYLGTTWTANTTTGAVTATPIRRGIQEGGTVDMSALAAAGGIPNGTYQAMPSRSVKGFYLGCDHAVAGFKITGGTGQVRIKLPVWWFR